MKLFLFVLVLVAQTASAQLLINQEKFQADLKSAFGNSISGLADSDRVLEANTSCELVDVDGHKHIYARYQCFSEAEALKTKEMLAGWAEEIMPGDIAKTRGYGAECFDYLRYTFAYSSEIYAEVKKRPIVTIGAIMEGEKYYVYVMLEEPYFLNQYTPNWE